MPCCSIKPVSAAAAAAAAAETHHDWRQNPAPHALKTPGAGMVVFATTSPSGPTFAGWSATQQAVTELDLGSLAMRACLGRRRIEHCIYCDVRISCGHELAGMEPR